MEDVDRDLLMRVIGEDESEFLNRRLMAAIDVIVIVAVAEIEKENKVIWG